MLTCSIAVKEELRAGTDPPEIEIYSDPPNTQSTPVTAMPDPAKAEQSFHILVYPADSGEVSKRVSKMIMTSVEMAIAMREITNVLMEVWIYSFHEKFVSKLVGECLKVWIQALMVVWEGARGIRLGLLGSQGCRVK